jgi:hypothetical protein
MSVRTTWRAHGPRAVVLLALCAFFWQGIVFIHHNSTTHDEPAHVGAGILNLKTRSVAHANWHPPLPMFLAALVLELAYAPEFRVDVAKLRVIPADRYLFYTALGKQALHDPKGPGVERALLWARLPGLLLGCVTLLFIALWAWRLWGPEAGALAAMLAAFEPNLLANACIVGHDGPLACFATGTLYFAHRLTLSARRRDWVGLGLCLFGAFLSKFSAIVLLPMLAVGAGFHFWRRRHAAGGRFAVRWSPRVLYVFLGVTAAGLGLLLLFTEVFTAWWDGLGQQLWHVEEGHLAFFRGESSKDGFLLYFVAALALKIPLATLLLILASVVAYRRGEKLSAVSVGFLVVAPFLFIVAMTMAQVHLGVRLVLPAIPPLLVLAARCQTFKTLAARAVVWILFAWSALSVLSVAPYHLSYFNEIAGGPDRGHEWFADGNTDSGQGLYALTTFLQKRGNPQIYFERYGTDEPSFYGVDALPWGAIDKKPTQRFLFVVTVHRLGGRPDHFFDWLLTKEPIARLAHVLWVYELDPKDIAGKVVLR